MSYQTLTTNLGLAKIAAAIGSGQTISLPTIKLGDGNGNPVTPSPTQIDLVRVVYSGATNSLTVSQSNPNRVTAELVVPASVGGFTVREAGIYDSTGALIFVSNFPDVYKPLPSEGAARDLVVRIVFEVVNSGVINLVIDTNVVVATRAWVTSNFTIAALLPGGTTYQILRKKSNANGDTEWVDPASGQNIVVNVIEENQILAASQTVVNLVTANTNSTAVYIEGVRLRNNQFSINTATQFTLAQSYPAGSRVTIVQNEPNGAIAQATTESAGIVELATNAETQAGTDATRAVTPAGLASAATLFVPTGAVLPFAMNSAPSGWLSANGAAVSRATYASLFTAIGTLYGAGDGSTTFNLPDLRGYFVRGSGTNSDGTASGTFGTKQADEFKSHAHTGSALSAGAHAHTTPTGGYSNYNESGGGGAVVSIYNNGANTGTAGDHTHTLSINATGGTETRPKNIAMFYCIKF
jgi:phage-related tail fiber protein